MSLNSLDFNFKISTIACVLLTSISCKDDPTGPEMNCHLNELYVQDYHFVKASNVYNIQTDPPVEIKNGKIEYGLFSQWAFHIHDDTLPLPYSEYYIDSIDFLNPSEVNIHFYESENSRIYTYARNDCGLDLHSTNGDLHLELTHGGDEMTEQRFAIYDHRSKEVTIDSQYFKLDTFSFLEFRLGAFSSYEEIIQQFAHDHPGVYDTVAIELVQNKTKE